MDTLPYGYVYRITNLKNGKTYIGQRKLAKDSSWREYMGSGVLVKNAISKYGLENFAKTFLSYAQDKQTLDFQELHFITEEKMAGRGQYNLFVGLGAGGDTFTHSSLEAREKALRNRARGMKKKFEDGYKVWNAGETKSSHPALLAKSLRAKKLGTYSKIKRPKVTDQTKQVISQALKGNISQS